jgi:hypothetical protein
VAGEAAREGLGVNPEALRALQSGPLYRFADWPNAEVPIVAVGLYTVWGSEGFIYVGMAGRASGGAAGQA